MPSSRKYQRIGREPGGGAFKEAGSNVGATFILILVVIGVILAVVLPPILSQSPDALPLPTLLEFETLPGDAFWQRRLCECNNSWDFASDERNISNAIFSQVTTELDPRYLSALTAFWGQVIDHDVVLTTNNASDGMFFIPMTPRDDVLIRLTRANHRINDDNCRETINNISSTLDASFVYGGPGHEALLAMLRDGSNCKLRTSDGNLLPFHPTSPHEFLAGDERSTEHAVRTSPPPSPQFLTRSPLGACFTPYALDARTQSFV